MNVQLAHLLKSVTVSLFLLFYFSAYAFASQHNQSPPLKFILGFTITATADSNGTISPSGDVAVSPGANQTFTMTPNTGFSFQYSC